MEKCLVGERRKWQNMEKCLVGEGTRRTEEGRGHQASEDAFEGQDARPPNPLEAMLPETLMPSLRGDMGSFP
jgi:hypothetical protein